MSKCCVAHCPNGVKITKKVTFFSIPRDKDLQKRWYEILKLGVPNPFERHIRVCIRHFDEDDYFQYSMMKRLKPKRVPHLHLTIEEDADENVDPNTQHIHVAESSSRQQQILRRKRKIIAVPFRCNPPFAIENFSRSDRKVCRYTGFQKYSILLVLFNFTLKSEEDGEGGLHVTQSKTNRRSSHKLTPLNELFLTLIKLRKGIEFHVLGDMFWISEAAACRIFHAWIDLLYRKLGNLNIFPCKETLLKYAPIKFLQKYPNVIGSIDCTEFRIETPSSLVAQSQCYSNYKGCTTLKALLMINANGVIIFVSSLYSGSISDKEIVKVSGFQRLLKKKVDTGALDNGDIILADKGFNIQTLLDDVGIELNIPTFRLGGMQFSPEEVENIRKVAHERVHVERAIRRIKTYKILSFQIPISLLGSINQIFTVRALLTNFRYPLRK